MAATEDVEAMPGLLKITFNSMALLALMGRSRPTQWAMTTPVVKPNAKQTNVGGDFPHLFDISSEGARVLVFTDKEQDTPGVDGGNGGDHHKRCSHWQQIESAG